MAIQDRLYTARDLEAMPDDGKLYELHNGVLIEVAGSKLRQSQLASWVIYIITAYIIENRLGGIVTGADGTFELNLYNTRIPDVGYITAENAEHQNKDSYPVGAPDLAVEVVSPSNSPREMQQRAGEYLTAGSKLVWIVDPETKTVDVYRTDGVRNVYSGDRVLDGGDVLPGLSIPLDRLFNPMQA